MQFFLVDRSREAQGNAQKFRPWNFQLAAARYTPEPHFMSQRLTPLTHAGASCPRREALNKSALPYRRTKRINHQACATRADKHPDTWPSYHPPRQLPAFTLPDGLARCK
jgi:hypothetical protein